MDINQVANKNTAEAFGKQFLIFKVADENYGLKLTQAKEIIKPTKVTNVPNSEEYILGVINLRGQVIPVVNLENKLGFLEHDGEKNYLPVDQEKKIIVVNIQNMLIGLLVDSVEEVIKLTQDQIDDVFESRQGIQEDFLSGVAIVEDSLIMVLDLESSLFETIE